MLWREVIGRVPIRPTSHAHILLAMPDLRTLSIEQRRQLSAEAERRARAGEAPSAIRAALGISTRAVLDLVEAALAAGETARADQLLAAWRRRSRRDRTLEQLERQAKGDDVQAELAEMYRVADAVFALQAEREAAAARDSRSPKEGDAPPSDPPGPQVRPL